MTLSRRRFAATAALTPLIASTVQHAAARQSTPSASPAAADIQSALDQALLESGVPGAIVLLDHPESGIQTWAVGEANVETGNAMSTDMHMRIGSISKTYLSTVMLQLVDEGVYSLDDSLASLSGTFDAIPNADAMTIREILGMRAGLNDFLISPGYLNATTADLSREYSADELLGYAAEQDAVGQPGDEVAYSNTGYLILGMLAEELTGSTYQELIQTRILDHLGLNATSIPATSELPDPAPRGYMFFRAAQASASAEQPAASPIATPMATPINDWVSLGDESGPYDVTEFSPSSVSAAGAMVSTLEDTNTWLKTLAAGSLLSQEMYEAQMTGEPLDSEGQSMYGLGVLLGEGMVGHNGGVPGFQSNALAFLETDMRIVVFTNAYPGPNMPDSTSPFIMPLIGE